MITPQIKNLIFDLGGVILDLSVESTMKKMAEATGFSLEQVVEAYKFHPEFIEYEKGLISDEDFRKAIRRIFKFDASDVAIDEAWNAMLLDIPADKIELLKKLKTRFRVFLLSNTNNIHLQYFNGIVSRSHGMASLEPLFEKAYYSHVMKMRKPDAEIYEQVLKENKLVAEETIFFDDNLSNLAGAASVGIKTFHVEHPNMIFSVFNES